MYKVSWQVIPFPHNVNEERIFVTITNRSSQVKFIVMVSSSMRTIGKLKEIWEREMVDTKNYLIQYCAKVMQTIIDKYRALFSRFIVDISAKQHMDC